LKQTPRDKSYDIKNEYTYGASGINLVMVGFESFDLESWKIT